MQNCPITHITLLKHAHATQLYTPGGSFFLLQTVRERALYQTTRRRPWRGSAYQTLRRRGAFFSTRLYEDTFYHTTQRRRPPQRGEGFESCARGLLPHSLTTILHGGGEAKTKLRCLLPLCFILYTSHAIFL